MIPDPLEHLYSQTARTAQPSTIRDLCSLVAKPKMRSLAGGWPDPNVFPSKELARIFKNVLIERPTEVLQYGATEGLLELRQAIVEHIVQPDEGQIQADNVLITSGSSQGMSLAAQVFIEKGDVVLVGLPTYFGGSGAIASRGGKSVGIPLDRNGMDPNELAAKLEELKNNRRQVKGIYIIPNFQNPAGVTMPLAGRRRILDLAAQYDLVIFEDDPYGELRYEGAKIPSLFTLDQNGRVILMRSFSKIFAPGMRLGWVTGPAGAVRQMAVAKQFADATNSTPTQFMLLEFIKQGLMAKRIAANIDFYRKKRDFMLTQMDRHFPSEITWNKPLGGFFIFVHLPEEWDAADLLKAAVARDVAFITGQPFHVDGSGRNTLRLSFSQAGYEDMEAAIQEIGALIKSRLARSKS